MVIQIKIPQNTIDICKEYRWDELETKQYFSRYLTEVLFNHPYGQFEQDFRIWLEDLEE